ncbi:lycopene cyclase domain-containing protein [Microbacterium sp. AZCO]|uniref:lycopene cyclase domain-containing protein n=1 Tax=Microbacterium sp. AZCO TaxID=3142976 RepID=UPI0031F3A3B4
MPGAYLAAILLSFAGIAVLDVRLRLAFPVAPGRTAAAGALGTAFFLLWDLVGIGAGVFVKGDSALYVGVVLAPHLPLEEPVFLAFLCYLALVSWAGAQRVLGRRASARTQEHAR